jgi:predicted ATPase/DNA-binding CsgD family transcriptional regulator
MGRSGSRGLVGFPVEATSFVGRRHELAEAKRLLSAARLLTLTGPGGVGKTRFAIRLAEQVARAFPDGVWLVPLATVRDGALVPYAVADALETHDEAGRPPLEVLVGHLRNRRLLLVMDNCEHLPEACASLIGTVLAATEGVQVLATSRHRLGLTEEQLYPVDPLATPDQETPLHRAAAEQFPVLRLFADRAAAVAPGFMITEENQAAVARLCRRLDGLPLAIELAAARMQALNVEQLEARLGDWHRLLASGNPTAPPRHQTLQSAVDWSYDLCTPGERLAWARLAVFAGNFDLDAAEAVCGAGSLDQADVLDALVGLIAKSILVRDDSGSGVRYRMLELLRQYGMERLEAMGDVAETRRRYRDHFMRLAEECGRKWFGPDQTAIVARLRIEQDNVRAALDHCLLAPDEARQGLRLVGSLWFYWVARGAWVEVRHWWRRLLQRAGGTSGGAPTRAVWLTAVMPAIHSRSTAVLLTGPLPEPTIQIRGTPMVKPLADVVTSGRETPEEQLGFHILNRVEIACTLTFHGRPERAVPLCAEALAVCEAYGEQWARSYVLRTLATALWALGDHEAAEDAARECLRLEYVAHEPHAVGRTLEVLAVVAVSRGILERAAMLQGAAQRIWYDIGNDPMGKPREAGRGPVGTRQGRLTLDGHESEPAYRRGLELTVEEAIAYALGDLSVLPVRAVPDRSTGSDPASAPEMDAGLTRRELEVAELIAEGMTNRQIAEVLVISRRTAEGHVERILAKLGFTSRSQVATWISGRRASRPGD